MKARWMAPAAVLGALCVATGAVAQQDGGGFDEAMQQWMQYMMPGEQHQGLQFFVGDWTFVNHMNMEGQQMTEEGTYHADMMMGGRFLHASHKGQMMGMPFEGASITGYDNVEKRFFNVWFDNMGTGMMLSYGTGDTKGNMTVEGTMTDPMRGEVHHKMVTTVTGPDSYKFEMFMVQPEGDERVMEILYTRVKS